MIDLCSEMKLSDRVLRINQAQGEIKAIRESADAAIKALNAEIVRHRTVLNQVENGLDVGLIEFAETFMYAGNFAKAGQDRVTARADAMAAIASGGGVLFSGYIGTKNYAHWSGQRSDHSYGMGPRHGSVVFEIGLRQCVRNRNPKMLTEAEREAGVYYLVHLESIQNARTKATETTP